MDPPDVVYFHVTSPGAHETAGLDRDVLALFLTLVGILGLAGRRPGVGGGLADRTGVDYGGRGDDGRR